MFITSFLRKYLWVALAATTFSTATFAYLYKESLQDIARVRAEAQVEALEAANARGAAVAQRVEAAAAERERVLQSRITELNRVNAEARSRAEAANQALKEFDTSVNEDTSEEYEVWEKTEVPSGVVTRLRGLAQ